jgi:hypothetical protein
LLREWDEDDPRARASALQAVVDLIHVPSIVDAICEEVDRLDG